MLCWRAWPYWVRNQPKQLLLVSEWASSLLVHMAMATGTRTHAILTPGTGAVILTPSMARTAIRMDFTAAIGAVGVTRATTADTATAEAMATVAVMDMAEATATVAVTGIGEVTGTEVLVDTPLATRVEDLADAAVASSGVAREADSVVVVTADLVAATAVGVIGKASLLVAL